MTKQEAVDYVDREYVAKWVKQWGWDVASEMRKRVRRMMSLRSKKAWKHFERMQTSLLVSTLIRICSACEDARPKEVKANVVKCGK